VVGSGLFETWANAVSQRRSPASEGRNGGGAVSAQHHPRSTG